MEFKELQEVLLLALKRRGEKDGVATATNEDAIMKIGEEYGEFVQAYLIHKKQCKKSKLLPEEESKELLSRELADVVGAAMVAGHMLDISIEEVLLRKWVQAD